MSESGRSGITSTVYLDFSQQNSVIYRRDREKLQTEFLVTFSNCIQSRTSKFNKNPMAFLLSAVHPNPTIPKAMIFYLSIIYFCSGVH